MTKLTHKDLKNLGQALNGKYFDGNIYAHENRLYYLTSYRLLHTDCREEIFREIEHYEHEILELAKEIAESGADSVNTIQLAYSHGTYGNSGQLHKIDYYKDGQIIKTIFLYV